MSLGGQGPAHAIAQDVQIHRATEVATFTGQARLWQQDNSICRPGDRARPQTEDRWSRAVPISADPVRVVMLSAAK